MAKPVLKTEHGGFNVFAGDPGNERIGPVCLQVAPVISGEASSDVDCHFFRISFWKMSTHSSFLKISFGRDFTRKTGPIFGSNVDTSLEISWWFFSPKMATREKIRTMPLEKRRTGLDASHHRIASTLRRASPNRLDSGCKTRGTTKKTEFRIFFVAVLKTVP